MDVVVNEKKYAETCIESGLITDDPFYTLRILASYFHYEMKFNKARIEIELADFLERNSNIYRDNFAFWIGVIESFADNAAKYKLCEANGVCVSDKEMETIDTLPNIHSKKIAFVLLCLAKLGNIRNPDNNNWIRLDYFNVFKMARYNGKREQRNTKLREIYMAGLIYMSKWSDKMTVRIDYLDNNAGKSPEGYFIDDFRELGYTYLTLIGEKVPACKVCGRLINPKNKKMVCENCAITKSVQYKSMVCVDCGSTFVRPLNSRQTRCTKCAKNERRRINRENIKKWRKKSNNFQ